MMPGKTGADLIAVIKNDRALAATPVVVLTSMGMAHSFWMDPSILGLPAGPPRFNTEQCFHMEVAPTAEVDLALDEHSEYRWCGFQEAHDLMLWEGSKAAVLRLRQLLGAHVS